MTFWNQTRTVHRKLHFWTEVFWRLSVWVLHNQENSAPDSWTPSTAQEKPGFPWSGCLFFLGYHFKVPKSDRNQISHDISFFIGKKFFFFHVSHLEIPHALLIKTRERWIKYSLFKAFVFKSTFYELSPLPNTQLFEVICWQTEN